MRRKNQHTYTTEGFGHVRRCRHGDGKTVPVPAENTEDFRSGPDSGGVWHFSSLVRRSDRLYSGFSRMAADSGNRTAAGPTVPPGGLYMTHLWYDDGIDKFEVSAE